MTEQNNTDTLPERQVADRTLAIRQAIKAGDRGLELQTMDDFARFAMKVAGRKSRGIIPGDRSGKEFKQ